MADTFRIIPYVVRSAGTDVPPEEVQAAVNSLAQQTTIALNSVASDPTGPAGGDLGGAYPNPTVVGSHITSGTINGATIGQTTPAAGSFTTLTATTPVGVTSGGTGQNALNAHNVIIGEGSSAVAFAAPGTSGQILASNGAAVDPSFQTKAALTIASSGANSDITSLSGLTTALSVAQGGTGRQTLTAHGVLLGEGTAAVNQTSAGTSGQPLLSGGAGADPNWGTLTPSFGGTGLTTLTAHAVLLGEGTSNVAFAAPGTAGQALVSAGATSDPVFGFPTGALIGVQVFTATGTYTATTGTNSVIVEVQAPGGGGGGVSATGAGQVALAQPGSGGTYAKARVTSSFNGVTVTIGTTGTGGAAGVNAGASGGTTSFGTIVSCPGGTGGAGSAAVSPPASQSPASLPASATITGATTLINTAGGMGTSANSPSASVAFLGQGGASAMGMGSGTGNGSGGSGAAIAQSIGATAGQNGSPGKIIVYEYA